MKRRIHCNVWGNWNGYLGRAKVEAFGTDEAEARSWLETGKRTPYDRAGNLADIAEMATFRKAAAAGLWDWEANKPK